MSWTPPYAHRLVDKVAVITGGASGIGRAMCERFAAEGAKVAVVDVDEAKGSELAESIDGMFVGDVTSATAVEALYEAVSGHYGGIDICCNNAGISPPDDDSILDTGLEAWRRLQEVDLHFGLLVLQVRDPAPRRTRWRIGRQHGLVRGRHGGGHQPDQLQRQQGRGPDHVTASSACSFTTPGRPGQCAVPGSGQHALAAGALRLRPRTGGPTTGTHPHGAFRRGDRDRRRRRLLGSDNSSFMTASTFLVDGGISAAYVTPL